MTDCRCVFAMHFFFGCILFGCINLKKNERACARKNKLETNMHARIYDLLTKHKINMESSSVFFSNIAPFRRISIVLALDKSSSYNSPRPSFPAAEMYFTIVARVSGVLLSINDFTIDLAVIKVDEVMVLFVVVDTTLVDIICVVIFGVLVRRELNI